MDYELAPSIVGEKWRVHRRCVTPARPAEDEPEQGQPEGWCRKHGVQMKERKGKYGPFYSHMTAHGWCHGK
jgi:hypothetical protein